MASKLTLSVDESTAEIAKRAAKARNTSVSAMLSRFVAGLDGMDRPRGSLPIAPLTLAATGLVRLPADEATSTRPTLAKGAETDDSLLEDALWDRYGPR